MTPALAGLAFLIAAVESYLAVRRMQAVMQASPARAATWDMVFGGFIGATVLLIALEGWTILPMLPGYWLGTYTAKRWR